MTKVFGDYSRYYSLLNRDKDYAAEVDYLLVLLGRYGKQPVSTLLDLGCGAGGHAWHLARHGVKVTGIDRSPAMLAEARQGAPSAAALGTADFPEFIEHDLTSLNLGRCFPVVISLFHVISYQISDESLADAFHCAASHLEEGGLFVFDFWYGPAVLAQKPEQRVREVRVEKLTIRRTAQPILHMEKQTVDVNFTVEVDNATDGTRQILRETHVMRYLFLPDLVERLGRAGMKLLRAEEWLTGAEPGPTTWSVCVVARKEKA